MTKTFVLMTALPPTKGHLELIQFASYLPGDELIVMLQTQPEEPYVEERYTALNSALRRCAIPATLRHMNETLEQNPDAPGFWEMWQGIMWDAGFHSNDTIVASEAYGQQLALKCGGKFMPYDLDRSITPIKATRVRNDPFHRIAEILPEFQPYIRPTVTIFGAESTGKTTLARDLAAMFDGKWLFEWARPYLEHTTNEITVRTMTDIWHGQRALQNQGRSLYDVPVIVQDTDLFSTVGYWNFPHWESIGDCPDGLLRDARNLKSDLYILTQSNIPFEEDPLRYGGTVREGSDRYWRDVLDAENLPYVILQNSGHESRLGEAFDAITNVMQKKRESLRYDRHGL